MISLSRIRSHVKLPAGNAEEFEAIQAEVISAFESRTGLLWNRREDHVETLETDELHPTNEVMLSLMGPRTISSVKERRPGDTWTTLTASEYEELGERRLRKVDGAFLPRVQVTYTGGYDERSCPQDIQRALLAQAAFIVERTSAGQLTVSAQAIEGGSTTMLEPTYHPVFKEVAKQRGRKV